MGIGVQSLFIFGLTGESQSCENNPSRANYWEISTNTTKERSIDVKMIITNNEGACHVKNVCAHHQVEMIDCFPVTLNSIYQVHQRSCKGPGRGPKSTSETEKTKPEVIIAFVVTL